MAHFDFLWRLLPRVDRVLCSVYDDLMTLNRSPAGRARVGNGRAEVGRRSEEVGGGRRRLEAVGGGRMMVGHRSDSSGLRSDSGRAAISISRVAVG